MTFMAHLMFLPIGGTPIETFSTLHAIMCVDMSMNIAPVRYA